jgi:hypothetical protein
MRSAVVAGGVGLGALALILLGTVFAARSMVRWRRRLDAAATAGAGAPLPWSAGAPLPDSAGTPLPGSAGAPAPGSAGAVSAGFFWRSHPLLKQLLRLIDSWELNEDDPERLANLFEMDHLTTRIWRNSESALVLTGHETPRPAEPLALLDVLRAASSEIEDYNRVTLDVQQGVWVSGSAAADTVHLLAELLENATTFSPETTQVIVSGHAVYGGGSLITITDDGTGMSEEGLTLLNRHLVAPAIGDTTAALHIGLSAVALLAARHGITVTLSMPPDGGTTVEVYLPAALISLDTGAERPPGPEIDVPEALSLMLGAPVPSAAPGISTGEPEPEPMNAEPGDGPPIFESVRSGHFYAFGRDQLRAGEQQAGQPPAERPPRPEASERGGTSRPLVWPPTAGPPASSGLPQRVPQPGRVRGRAAGQETRQAPVAEPAEITRSKLASGFQRGSRQAQTAAGPNRNAKQPGEDG